MRNFVTFLSERWLVWSETVSFELWYHNWILTGGHLLMHLSWVFNLQFRPSQCCRTSLSKTDKSFLHGMSQLLSRFVPDSHRKSNAVLTRYIFNSMWPFAHKRIVLWLSAADSSISLSQPICTLHRPTSFRSRGRCHGKVGTTPFGQGIWEKSVMNFITIGWNK
jgi:hypothetical protein